MHKVAEVEIDKVVDVVVDKSTKIQSTKQQQQKQKRSLVIAEPPLIPPAYLPNCYKITFDKTQF